MIKLSDKEFIGFWKDITESKKQEELLKENEEKFRSYFEFSPNPISDNR